MGEIANNSVLEHARSGTARAALLGVSDGLVTNISLILGVAGAGASPQVVRLAGMASLLAGAFSMAVGEYISMRGQVELLEGVLRVERQELERRPEAVHQALAEILREDGLDAQTADHAATAVMRDPDKAMAVYARGKLGINPEELGSVWGAALSSLIMFAIGAIVPLSPWFALSGVTAILASLALSILAALGIGAYLGYTTGGDKAKAAIRQLLLLVAAAGASYVIGSLLGVKAG